MKKIQLILKLGTMLGTVCMVFGMTCVIYALPGFASQLERLSFVEGAGLAFLCLSLDGTIEVGKASRIILGMLAGTLIILAPFAIVG